MTVFNKVSFYYRHMMQKKILETIIFIIFCDSLMMDQRPKFPFTTSKTMRDYYLQTCQIRVFSRGAERYELGYQKIRKYQESAQAPQNDSPAPSRAPKMKILSIPAKIVRKIAIKPFPQCAISHENQSQFQIFCD